jgi:enoyl-CoA hydratase/carnithine racemase
MNDVIQYYREENRGYIKLSNPPQNRMDKAFIEGFTKLIDTIDDSKIHSLILYGEGRHFSSGADVDELVELSSIDSDFFAVNIRNFKWLESRPYPTVAAVSGCALGFGLELALCCHYRIATKNAVFALPESGFGLIPGCGGTIRLPSLIGRSESVKMVLQGNMMSSSEALEIGLIDKIVEKKNLLQEAETITGKLY